MTRTLHFWVDYRNLNTVAKRDSCLMPSMDECIDLLGKPTIFSMLDASSGYWQIEVEDADKGKTNFTWHHGLYRFVRMPLVYKILRVHFILL